VTGGTGVSVIGTGGSDNPYVVSVSGSAVSPYYHPEDYGAVGDGSTDDFAAIMAATNAAEAAGGGTVYFKELYAWTGTLLIPPTVRWLGAATSFSGGSTGLIALDGTSRVQMGDIPAGGQAYTGQIENLVIDGNGVGGATQLLRIESVNASLSKVVVHNGVGDGIDLASSQNVSFFGIDCGDFPNGTALNIRNRDEAASTQGPGGNKFFGCYFYGADLLFDVDTVDAGGFWPHDNIFFGCLFEQYQEDCIALGHLGDGESRFSHCTFTGSAGMLNVTEDCLILIDNESRPAFPTNATFDSCDFGGGAVGVSHLIRCVSYSQANLLRIYGKTNIANANQGFFLCDDRSGGGIGVVGGVFGPIDGLNPAENTGLQLSTGINGGNAAIFVTILRQPMRLMMDDDQGSPFQIRRLADVTNRLQISREGAVSWLDGTTSTTWGSISRNGGTSRMNVGSGAWEFTTGIGQTPQIRNIGSNTAVTIDVLQESHVSLAMSSGADVTSVTINNGYAGARLDISVIGNTTDLIDWTAGTTINWADGQTGPQALVAGTITTVRLMYYSGAWYEVSRSNRVNQMFADRVPLPAQEMFSRRFASANASMPTQNCRVTFFTPYLTQVVNSLRSFTSGTAAGATPTTCKMGLYSVDPSTGDLTRIGITANNTGLWAAANTAYTQALTSPVTVYAGHRYAFAALIDTAAATPTLVAETLQQSVANTNNRLCGTVSGLQTDIPASILSTGFVVAASALYGELVT